ncbi:Hint domain-containing protein [Rhodovulum bhavnagarense]|uniref:Hint domain-containing protein n=1 Tax=Rhodovulum bhavnagarense TaxID=992286 RepID=A0A4R2RK48_9RHOB|nr:Hint domain-containing protein [Rhodovulum bhavnagarense]TCP60061.1 Hint domain-containing protein [Rhodovulum bhavnagarense]
MSWIAVTDPSTPGGLAPCPGDASATGSALRRGSLQIEAELGRAHLAEGTLLLLHVPGPRPRHLSIQITAGSRVVLAHRLGRRRYQVTLDRGAAHLSGRIRLTLCWDMVAGRGLLSLEEAAEGILVQKEFPDPLPLIQEDIALLCNGAGGVRLHGGIDCVAIADTLEPVGLRPSIAAGTPVLTPTGPAPIETLRPGDLVKTRDNGSVPVRWAGGHEVPALGGAAPVQLLAPYLGLAQDIIVAPEQRLVIGGADVEYLFGADEVLIEAQWLCPGPHALRRRGLCVLRYHQVLLDRHEIVEAAGCPIESLFVGQIRKSPRVLATSCLHALPAEALPLHDIPARRLLREFEAATLRSALLSR